MQAVKQEQPMNRPTGTITVWPNIKTTKGTRRSIDWVDLVDLLTDKADVVPTKMQQKLFKGCSMAGDNRKSGAVCETHSFIVGDYDEGLIQVDEAKNRLEELDMQGLVYTTASHKPEAPHWRVVVPLAFPVQHSTDAFETLVGRLNAALGGCLAPESYRPSQAWYFGRVSQIPFELASTTGTRALDDCTEIVSQPKRLEPAQPQNTHHKLAETFEVPISAKMLVALEAALQAIPTDNRDTWIRITYALATLRGLAVELQIKALWLSWTQRSEKYQPTDDELWAQANPSQTHYSVVFTEALEHGWVDARPQPGSEVLEYLTNLKAVDEAQAYRVWAFKAAPLSTADAFQVVILMEDKIHHPRRILQKELKEAVGCLEAEKAEYVRQTRLAGRASILFEPESTSQQGIEIANRLVATQPVHEFARAGDQLISIKRSRVTIPGAKSVSSLPPEAYQFIPHTQASLIALVERIAVYEKTVNRKFVSIEVPKAIITQVETFHDLNCPAVTGLSNHPFVLTGGDIVQTTGLDPTTGVYLTAPTTSYTSFNTLEECRAAYKELCSMPCFSDFAFADPVRDTVKAVTRLLHGLQRVIYRRAPLFAVNAPTAGSGKTALIEYVQAVITGVPLVATTVPNNDEEMRKQLLSYVLSGVSDIMFDNIPNHRPFESPVLCAYATAPIFEARILGLSKMGKGLTNSCIDLNGNGLVAGGDLASRVVIIDLDTKRANAFSKVYATKSIYNQALANRPRTLALLVGILAWSNAENKTNPVITTKSIRFEEWDRDIRSCILRLTEIDLADEMTRDIAAGPENTRDYKLLSLLLAQGGGGPSLIADATGTNAGLSDAFEEYSFFDRSRRADGRTKSATMINKCLNTLQDKYITVDGVSALVLKRVTTKGGYYAWMVERVAAS